MSDQSDGLAHLRWPHSGRTGALNAGAYRAKMNAIPAGQCGKGQVADESVDLYGSEGWDSNPLAGLIVLRTSPARIIWARSCRA
jgi:hypothetical protein